MPDDVGQRLLDDPKRSLVHGRRHLLKIIIGMLLKQGHLSAG
jgi:hypothetical protein